MFNDAQDRVAGYVIDDQNITRGFLRKLDLIIGRVIEGSMGRVSKSAP